MRERQRDTSKIIKACIFYRPKFVYVKKISQNTYPREEFMNIAKHIDRGASANGWEKNNLYCD